MLFPQLEKYKGRTKEFDGILDHLNLFLQKALSKNLALGQPEKTFRYKEFVVEFNISKEYALLALEICKDEKILVSHYQFFCPETGIYLATYNSIEDAPDIIECDYHDHPEEHEIIHCTVEILFSFSSEFLNTIQEHSF